MYTVNFSGNPNWRDYDTIAQAENACVENGDTDKFYTVTAPGGEIISIVHAGKIFTVGPRCPICREPLELVDGEAFCWDEACEWGARK
jgi:hypothetical protein